jgi:hypothetical protein
MRYRLLGRTGLRVSELFLGAMRFGEGAGGASPDECRSMLDLYADAGGNVVDTAINYRGGQSESIIGELLEGARREGLLHRHLRHAGLGRFPREYARRVAWLDAFRGPSGAVQPVEPRYRT